jgi:hypothetical protein
MCRICLRLLTAVLAIVIASPLVAQQGGRQGGFGQQGMAMLLMNKSVAEELKLSDEQHEKVKKAVEEVTSKHREDLKAAFQDKNREKVQSIQKEISTALSQSLDGVLKPEQVKRLHQVEIQVAGPRAFQMERVQKALKLTDKQQEKVKDLEEGLTKAREESFKDIGKDKEKRQEAQKQLAAKSKEVMEKIASELSDDQKKAWKELTGAHFEFVPEQRRRPQ